MQEMRSHVRSSGANADGYRQKMPEMRRAQSGQATEYVQRFGGTRRRRVFVSDRDMSDGNLFAINPGYGEAETP